MNIGNFIVKNVKIHAIYCSHGEEQQLIERLKEFDIDDGFEFVYKSVGFALPVDLNNIIFVIFHREEHEMDSVVVHESVHVAQFINEVVLKNKWKRQSIRSRGFEEPMAYLIQEVYFKMKNFIDGANREFKFQYKPENYKQL